jgi:hypothetical protein
MKKNTKSIIPNQSKSKGVVKEMQLDGTLRKPDSSTKGMVKKWTIQTIPIGRVVSTTRKSE